MLDTSTTPNLDREISSGVARLKFTPAIERSFEKEIHSERVRLLVITTIIGLFLANLFLVTDWVALNDLFWPMLVGRVGFFTPMALIFVWLAPRTDRGWQLDVMVLTAGVVGVLLPMGMLAASDTPYALIYQNGSLLTLMFMTVVQRISFRFALVGIAIILAIQFTTLHLNGSLDFATYTSIVIFYVGAALFMGMAAYFLEYSNRLSFLLFLKSRILHDQLEESARVDPLTGLFNRRHLASVSKGLWSKTSTQFQVSALLIDVDHFKLFNDTQGHLAGDQCLRQLSDCVLAVAAASNGTGFRFGGEEILVLLPNTDLARAQAVGEAIRAAVQNAAIPLPALADGAFVTVSIGVAEVLTADDSPDLLLAAADQALYTAKRLGRNRVEISPMGYSPAV